MKDLTTLDEHRITRGMFGKYTEDPKTQGYFDFEINGDEYFVIATDGFGWQHVSVSGKNGEIPSFDIMEKVKKKFFHDTEITVEYFPKKEEYVNNKANCLHMWFPNDEAMPYPDMKEFKKHKPEMVSKNVVNIEGVPYLYTHQKDDEFELLSIQSGFKKRPSWEACCTIKEEVFGDTVAVSYHPAMGDSIHKLQKNSEDQIYIWRPVKDKIPTPPSLLVGIKNVSEDDLDKMTDFELAKKIDEEICKE